MKYLFSILILVNSSLGYAQANKCIDQNTGAKYYTDSICPNGSILNKTVTDLGSRDNKDLYRINKDVAAYKKNKAIENAIYERRVISGMSQDQVSQALGQPTSVNDNGGRVQFVYNYGASGNKYVYFKDGLTY